jgi:acetylornithine/succinyldiaminopimelate/putrescine aminotransferase
MIGVDLLVPVTPLVNACRERRVLVNGTHDTVLRLLPALTLTDEQFREGCAVLEEVLREAAQTPSRAGESP